MQATITLFFLIVVVAIGVSNCSCINRIELVCDKAPECNQCRGRKYGDYPIDEKSIELIGQNSNELNFDFPGTTKQFSYYSRGIPVQPLNYAQRSLPHYSRGKRPRLCRRYNCYIKSCKRTCTNINTSGPADFKIIDSDEDTDPSTQFYQFDESLESSPYHDEEIDSIPSIDDWEDLQHPQYYYDEIIDIPSFDEYDELYNNMQDFVPSFDDVCSKSC